jgi:hypothetical protein
MNLRPIALKTWEVQAILDGRKTQTRRVVKPEHLRGVVCDDTMYKQMKGRCPYGQPGDVLWVRETWCDPHHLVPEAGYQYKASKPDAPLKWKPSIHMPREAARLFLSIKSVRVERLQEISREDCIKEGIDYRITDFEKGYNLRGSWYDYERKTFNPLPSGKISPSMSFMSLWRSINGPESWEANPWVWLVEFERISRQEAEG